MLTHVYCKILSYVFVASVHYLISVKHFFRHPLRQRRPRAARGWRTTSIESGRRSRLRRWVLDDDEPSHLRQRQQRRVTATARRTIPRGRWWVSSDDDPSHLRQRQPTASHGNSATNHTAPVNTLPLLPTKHHPPLPSPERK